MKTRYLLLLLPFLLGTNWDISQYDVLYYKELGGDPGAAAAGTVRVYGKAGELCAESSAAVVTCMSTGGGGGGGDNISVSGSAVVDANFIASLYTTPVLDAGPAPDTIAFNFLYTNTLAGNPALNAQECVFTSSGASDGGLLCEGSITDTSEQLHIFTNTNGADTTDYFVVSTNVPTDDYLPIAVSGSQTTFKQVPNCGETGTLNYDTATNTFSCLTDSTTNTIEATADFGAGGSFDATVLGVAATWVTAASRIVCSTNDMATADRLDGNDDALLDELSVAAFNRVVGVTFDLKVHAPNRAFGKFIVHCMGI